VSGHHAEPSTAPPDRSGWTGGRPCCRWVAREDAAGHRGGSAGCGPGAPPTRAAVHDRGEDGTAPWRAPGPVTPNGVAAAAPSSRRHGGRRHRPPRPLRRRPWRTPHLRGPAGCALLAGVRSVHRVPRSVAAGWVPAGTPGHRIGARRIQITALTAISVPDGSGQVPVQVPPRRRCPAPRYDRGVTGPHRFLVTWGRMGASTSPPRWWRRGTPMTPW